MSIATLKRLTAHKYHNNSVGQKQFSINGTHRSAGWVGQTNAARSLPRTLMRGNTMRGSSSCCGMYRITPNIVSGTCNLNDNTVIKSSSISQKGLIAISRPWIKRPQPYTSVKSDTTNNRNIQSEYIDSIAMKATVNNRKCDEDNYINGKYIKNISLNSRCTSMQGFSRQTVEPNIAKPESQFVANTQSNHIQKIKLCRVSFQDTKFVSPSSNVPLV